MAGAWAEVDVTDFKILEHGLDFEEPELLCHIRGGSWDIIPTYLNINAQSRVCMQVLKRSPKLTLS